jgi:hypothetical protein
MSNIQLLLLAKYNTVVEFGMDCMLQPILDDIKKLESVNIPNLFLYVYNPSYNRGFPSW